MEEAENWKTGMLPSAIWNDGRLNFSIAKGEHSSFPLQISPIKRKRQQILNSGKNIIN